MTAENALHIATLELFILNFRENFFGPYMLCLDILLITGTVFFFLLPREKRKNHSYLLPFLILVLVLCYENLGAYTAYFRNSNQWVYQFFGSESTDNYNLWVWNIFNYQIGNFLFLALIKNWVKDPKRKKIIHYFQIGFVVLSILFQLVGLQPILDNQTLIYFIGSISVIIACGIFFIDLITSDYYLELNPLKLPSFWQITLILFQHTMMFLTEISFDYILSISNALLLSLYKISQTLYVLLLIVFVFSIGEPLFNKKNKVPALNV